MTQAILTKLGVKESSFEERGETFYNVDFVLDAYVKGVSHGERSAERAFDELMERNARDATKFVNAVSMQLGEIDIKIGAAYIKFDQWPEISFLLSISESDYLREEFSAIYDKIYSLEEEYNNNSLQICLSFIPLNPNFQEERVLSEGYLKLPNKQ